MESCGIYSGETLCGKLDAETDGLYTCFYAAFSAPPERLFRLWLDGERGQLALGVPEWDGARYVRRKSVANHLLQKIGPIRRGWISERSAAEEMHEAAGDEGGWIRLAHPEYFFHSLTPQLAEGGTCYWKPAEGGRLLAVPLKSNMPFLLPRYFCFARVRRIQGDSYAVFFFDRTGRPALPE